MSSVNSQTSGQIDEWRRTPPATSERRGYFRHLRGTGYFHSFISLSMISNKMFRYVLRCFLWAPKKKNEDEEKKKSEKIKLEFSPPNTILSFSVRAKKRFVSFSTAYCIMMAWCVMMISRWTATRFVRRFLISASCQGLFYFFIRNVFWEISINSLGAPFAKLRDSVYFMVDGVVVDANWTDLLINWFSEKHIA